MNFSTRFKIIALFAFASFISFLQIDGAFADRYNANSIFYITGFGFAGAIIYEAYLIAKEK